MQENTQERFDRLVKLWHEDTGWSSSMDFIMRHPAVDEIRNMGRTAIPLILKDMTKPERRGPFWYILLNELCDSKPDFTGLKQPVSGRIIGNMWMEWGVLKGYISRSADGNYVG